MSNRKRMIIKQIAMLIVCGLGIWYLEMGHTGMGCGLIASSIAVTVVQTIKNRRLEVQQAEGLNPYDERTVYIAGQAARSAMSAWVILTALLVMAGPALGPIWLVNPYNFAGINLAFVMLLYCAFYFYYNRSTVSSCHWGCFFSSWNCYGCRWSNQPWFKSTTRENS